MGTERKVQSRSQARRERRAAQLRSRTVPSRVALSPLGVALAVVALMALFLGAGFASGLLAPPGAGGPSGAPGAARTLVRSAAASVAFSNGSGWLADDAQGSVRRFDPLAGGLVGKPVHIGGTPISVAAGFGRLWVADISGSVLDVVDPTDSRATGSPISVAQGPVSVAAGCGGVWVASLLSGTLSLVDPRTGEVAASVALPDGAVRVALGAGYVWVTGQSDTLTRIDPKPLGVTLRWKTLTVGQGPIGVAVGGGAVWVANAESGTVSEVDPRTMSVTRTIPVTTGTGSVSTAVSGQTQSASGSDPQTVAFWDGRVWVGIGSSASLLAFDPRTGGEVGAPLRIPGVTRSLVVGQGGALWATTANPGRVVEVTGG